MIYILIGLSITAATLLAALQLRLPISALFGVTVIDHRCSGSVNRWANRRLESYRQELEADQQGKQAQPAADSNMATGLINRFDHLITERMLDQQRQEIIDTALRSSQCRPVFE